MKILRNKFYLNPVQDTKYSYTYKDILKHKQKQSYIAVFRIEFGSEQALDKRLISEEMNEFREKIKMI